MPIISTKTTTIPGLAAPATPDSIAYDLIVSATTEPAGVSAAGTVKIQSYRANDDGTNPLTIGPKQILLNADVFAEATKDAAAGNTLLAQLITAADAYVQWKVTQLGK